MWVRTIREVFQRHLSTEDLTAWVIQERWCGLLSHSGAPVGIAVWAAVTSDSPRNIFLNFVLLWSFDLCTKLTRDEKVSGVMVCYGVVYLVRLAAKEQTPRSVRWILQVGFGNCSTCCSVISPLQFLKSFSVSHCSVLRTKAETCFLIW